jgi:hypothetical protein
MSSSYTTITRTKSYPDDYPKDAIDILDAMSIDDNVMLVGSMSIRSQQYAGDYDAYEIVNKKGNIKNVLVDLRTKFQDNIKKLRSMENVFIGDIKAGSVEAWRIIPRSVYIENDKLHGYNATAFRRTVDELLKSKVITDIEAREAHALLKDQPTIPQYLNAKDKLKYHIIRWTVPEVLANHKKLRGGTSITLEQAFHSPGLTKLDVIGLVGGNRFTDFSMIYTFKCNGKILNPEPIVIKNSLEESILAYKAEGNYFKVLKRLFALAKLLHDEKTLIELTPILNSDLGRLYHIVSDIGTLITLLESYPNAPLDIIRYEIDQFVQRLSNIYTLNSYLRKDDAIVSEIHRILRLPEAKILAPLRTLYEELNSILQKSSKPIVEDIK